MECCQNVVKNNSFYCAEDGTFDLQGKHYNKGDHTIETNPGVNPVFIRPNHAIYRQMAVGQTIEDTRKSFFTIQAAYNGQSIQKQLFWDDNDNLDMNHNDKDKRVPRVAESEG